jgi:hypothetical protein
MLKEFFLFSLGLILYVGGIYFFWITLKRMFRNYKLKDFNKPVNYELRFPLKSLLIVMICLIIPFLNLGEKWYELIIKIIACFCLFNFIVPIHHFFTESVACSSFKFKRYLYFILYFILPVIVYLGLIIYFPFFSLW